MSTRAPLDRPEVCFLDLGDTLVRAHPAWAEVYAKVFPEFGMQMTRAEFDGAFAAAFAIGDASPMVRGAETRARIW